MAFFFTSPCKGEVGCRRPPGGGLLVLISTTPTQPSPFQGEGEEEPALDQRLANRSNSTSLRKSGSISFNGIMLGPSDGALSGS